MQDIYDYFFTNFYYLQYKIDIYVASSTMDIVFIASTNEYVLKKYIEFGLDINAVDTVGITALHFSSWIGNEESVKNLINNNATLDITEAHGLTALDLALLTKHTSISQYLLTKNAHKSELSSCILEHGLHTNKCEKNLPKQGFTNIATANDITLSGMDTNHSECSDSM